MRCARQGVEVVGRLAGIRDGKAQFSGSLRNVCALADLEDEPPARCDRRVDRAQRAGRRGRRLPSATRRPTSARHRGSGSRWASDVRTVVWATGFRPDYSWLDVPVFDRKGALKHDRGVVDAPGLYVLGLPFLRRRKSSFMHGAEDDVRELGAHLAGSPRAHAAGEAASVCRTLGLAGACARANRASDLRAGQVIEVSARP